jgi:prophage regulatory protein
MTADDRSRILRLGSVLERTGLSRSTLYRKIETGTFPMQVRISERCVGWRESEIEGWLRNPTFYRRRTERYDPLGLGLPDE